MANTKLLKVMDYLLNEQEDKARELLHQIFIEKARAIHEEMISDEHDHMMGGDEGEHLTNQIKGMEEEIDAEETANMEDVEHDDDADMDMEDAEEDLEGELEDADDVEMDADDADMDMDADTDEVEMDMGMEAGEESEDEKIHDLEQAIAELKAEFEALKNSEEGEHHEGSEEDDSEEDNMAEAWESDQDMHEDWTQDTNDLAENVDLEAVHAAKGGEVGSGRYAPAETNTRSPLPTTQTDMMGARPVKTGQGAKASGYDRQSAPDSKSMGLTNRRRDAEQGKHPVSKEGDSSALLNKGTSAGYGAVNTRSPISGRK